MGPQAGKGESARFPSVRPCWSGFGATVLVPPDHLDVLGRADLDESELLVQALARRRRLEVDGRRRRLLVAPVQDVFEEAATEPEALVLVLDPDRAQVCSGIVKCGVSLRSRPSSGGK